MKKVTLDELRAAFGEARANKKDNMQNNRRYYKFCYTAIRRYGEKKWTAQNGVIEFNPNYTVSCSTCEKPNFSSDTDQAYIVELSNGTKFLCFMRGFGRAHIEELLSEELLSEDGEQANIASDQATNFARTKQFLHQLNNQAY